MYHEACQQNSAINCIPVNADDDLSEQQLKTAAPGVETKEAWRVRSAVTTERQEKNVADIRQRTQDKSKIAMKSLVWKSRPRTSIFFTFPIHRVMQGYVHQTGWCKQQNTRTRWFKVFRYLWHKAEGDMLAQCICGRNGWVEWAPPMVNEARCEGMRYQ